jgi:hypothetical protein
MKMGPEMGSRIAEDPETGTVHARGLDQLVRDGDVVVAEEQRGEGQAVHHVHEHQARGGIGQAQLAQQARHRQEHHLERNEAAHQQAGEQHVRATEAPHRHT